MGVLVVGSSNTDIFCSVDRLPVVGETIFGKGISYAFGGKGGNQATALARMESDVVFMTCLGNDPQGDALIQSYKRDGIKVEYVKRSKDFPTGTAIINVDKDGKNNIVVVKGANDACDEAYIRENEDLFKSNDYILLQLEIPVPAVKLSIELAKKYGKKVVLNPAPAAVLDDEILSGVDFLTPNETELELLAFGNIDNRDVDLCAKKLLEKGVKNLIVTIGEKGVIYYRGSEKIHVEGIKVKAIDTVAAGDCFNGAFVSFLEKGKDVVEALKLANRASAISVTRKGAQDSIPRLSEVLSLGE